MKCLILAAGRGSRLSRAARSKPLLPVMGLPLLERTIRTARSAGLPEFVVVTGYEAETVERFLSDLSARLKVPISTVRNENWDKGNGTSVLKAKGILEDNFVLLMADHVFDEAILHRLLAEELGDDRVILAVDRRVGANEFVEPEDVTKVLVEGGHIREIGKNVEDYNAYDTGIFLCSPSVFEALEESLRRGDDTLSGGIRQTAKAGGARAFDIGDAYWIDVDTPATLKKAKRLLRRTLVKPHDGLVSRWLNRRFSIRIFTPLLLKLWPGITPNQASVVSFLVGLAACVCFFLRRPVVGGVLLQLASILDGCDGEIARLKKMQSSFGNFFDAVLDRYADTFVLFGMLYYSMTSPMNRELVGTYWGAHWSLIVIAIFMLAISGQLMVSYTSAKSVADFGYRYKGRLVAAGRGRDLRLFLLFIGGVAARVHPIAVSAAALLIAALTNAIVLWRTFVSWRHARGVGPLKVGTIRAVIFDFDGTVADTMPFLTKLAVDLLAENYGISKDDAKRRYLETTGLDFASQMELIFPGHPKNQKVADTFEARKLRGILKRPVFPDVVPSLEYFKQREIRGFICSSTNQTIITQYVKLCKIDSLLDECYGHRPHFGKDKQIDAILERHRLHPEEALFVGDSLRDHDFAKDKGVQFAGLARLFTQRDFHRKGAFCVRDLSALTRAFDRSRRLSKALDEVR